LTKAEEVALFVTLVIDRGRTGGEINF